MWDLKLDWQQHQELFWLNHDLFLWKRKSVASVDVSCEPQLLFFCTSQLSLDELGGDNVDASLYRHGLI